MPGKHQHSTRWSVHTFRVCASCASGVCLYECAREIKRERSCIRYIRMFVCKTSPRCSLVKCQRPLPSVPPTGSFKRGQPSFSSVAFTAVVFSSPCPPTQDPSLVTYPQLKLFKYNSCSFGTESFQFLTKKESLSN